MVSSGYEKRHERRVVTLSKKSSVKMQKPEVPDPSTDIVATGYSEKWRARAVLVAVYSCTVVISTTLYMNGVIYVAVLDRYPGNEAKTSLIGSLNTGIMCILSPLVSIVMDAQSCRVSIVTGGCFVALSFLLSAFVVDLDLLIVTYGLLSGIGNAFVSTPIVVVLGYYFHERRNLVIAMSVAVIGIGMFIASPLAFLILDMYGLQGSFLILSGITLHICVLGLICKPSLTEIQLHRHRNRHRTKIEIFQLKDSIISLCNVISDMFSNILHRKIITNVPFVIFLTSTVTWNLMLGICLLHLPNYVMLIGASTAKVTIIMTAFSASNTMGRFLSSLSVNIRSISSLTVHTVSLALCGLVTVTFPYYGRLKGADVVFASLVGLCTGAPNSVMTPITLQMVGLEFLSAAHGIENLFCGIGLLLGPPTAGFLLSQTGTYNTSFIFGGSIVLLGSLLGLTSACLMKRKDLATNVQCDDFMTETTEHKLVDNRYLPVETNIKVTYCAHIAEAEVLTNENENERMPCIEVHN